MFNQLTQWSQEKFSDLPWRKERTLFTTLVSEIMLQQTTVGTVLNHFDNFIKKFPNIESIANATDEEMTIAWKGLGYYRRARNLKNACKNIIENHDGEIPLDIQTLVNIPGIGPYTANAIVAIGANERGIALDANLERVLSRYYGVDIPKGPKLTKFLYNKFENKKILKGISNYRELNESLMDLGRNFCQANKTQCDLCFLRKDCKAFKSRDVLSYPKVEAKEKESFEDLELLRLICIDDGELLVHKRKSGQWLEGQWELPTFIIGAQSKVKQYPKITSSYPFENLPEYKTSITKYRIRNKVLVVSRKELSKLIGSSYKHDSLKGDWHHQNLSTASMKALNFLGF